jgi:hypothetical protein
MTEPLSPAAQAVKDAVIALYTDQQQIRDWGWRLDAPTVAAALRAAADQVVPEPPMIVEGGRTYEEAWTATVHGDIRRQLLTIAAELEGGND